MKQENIIKEYKNYCNDLNIDYKKNSSKNNFIYDYLKYLHDIGNLSCYENNFYKTQNELRNILKNI